MNKRFQKITSIFAGLTVFFILFNTQTAFSHFHIPTVNSGNAKKQIQINEPPETCLVCEIASIKFIEHETSLVISSPVYFHERVVSEKKTDHSFKLLFPTSGRSPPLS